MPGGRLQITQGATNYSFDLVDATAVFIKHTSGEIRRQTGRLVREDLLDAPWSVTDLAGLGCSRAGPAVPQADNRAYEMKNIDRWPNMICLAPQAQAATNVSGVRQVIGSAEGVGKLFYFANTNASARETIAFFVGSTTTWTSAGATAAYETASAGTGFPCTGMTRLVNAGVEYICAIRLIYLQNGASYYQFMTSTNGTTWTAATHTSVANTPSGAASTNCYGLIAINETLYTLAWNSASTPRVTLRQSTDGGTTWTTSTGGNVLGSQVAPQALLLYRDSAGVPYPWVLLREGAWYYTGATMALAVDFRGDIQGNNGQQPVVWAVDGVPNGYIVFPQGRGVRLFQWTTTGAFPITHNIAPTYNTQGLPGFRDGPVTALAAAPNILWAAIGGDSSSTTAGIYKRVSELLHPLGWFGPLYDLGTANRQIRTLFFSTLDDGVPRLHWFEDNATSGDTTAKFMANITQDPRTVSGYKHAASGSLILPKNDRGLPEITGPWRKVEVVGTNFSASNKVTPYVSADAAPLDSSGSWGTALADITASAGTANLAATPTGTGLAAAGLQARFDLAGASNQSPYIEVINLYVAKRPTPKYIRRFVINMNPGGSTVTRTLILSWLKTIVSATSDLTVTWSDEPGSVIMEPYRHNASSQVGLGIQTLSWTDDPEKPGTVMGHMTAKYAVLLLVEV